MKATQLGLAFALVTLVAAGSAAAYPQLQLAYDQTCTSCHLSPAGGNLLNENGLAVAESMSQFGGAPEFFYGKVGGPTWLALGGDLRGAGGFIATPEKVLAAFPMQIELYASAKISSVTVHANVGPRPSQEGNEAKTSVWSREHYLMWQQRPEENHGLYVRVGRFMPVFGLRFAEHPMYTRRHGGTPLYSETYGASASLVEPTYEAHATAFIKDPLIDPVMHDNGGAVYGEYRPTEQLAVGVEGMYTNSASDQKIRGGVTGKLYVPGAKLLLQAELQFVSQLIDRTPSNPAQGNPRGLVGNLTGSFMLTDFLMIDLGVGHYDENLAYKDLDRDCVDLNVHWFTTSHVELGLNARFEKLAFGAGGPSSGYTLLQLHYRL